MRWGPAVEAPRSCSAARGCGYSVVVVKAMQKLRIGTGGISGGRRAHAAVSRRPPIPLARIVARTRMYTDAAKVWDSSIVQGFSVAPCPNPTVTIRSFSIAVLRSVPRLPWSCVRYQRRRGEVCARRGRVGRRRRENETMRTESDSISLHEFSPSSRSSGSVCTRTAPSASGTATL